MSQRYAYYPGCSALKSAIELDLVTRKLMDALGIDWVPLDEAACCGSRECGGLKVVDEMLSLANNARTFSMAEAAGAETIINVCSTCQLELQGENKRLQEDSALLEQTNRVLKGIDRHYDSSVTVKHLLYVILEDIGIEKFRQEVRQPLKGLKIAPFYGCHLLRPTDIHEQREDPYAPKSLGFLIETLGGEEVQYNGATKCCGFHSIIVNSKPPMEMSGRHLLTAKDQGADLIVTPCPLCHTVLDCYQPRIERYLRKRIRMPVLHLSQLVGIAIGMPLQDLGLSRHIIDPVPVLTALRGK